MISKVRFVEGWILGRASSVNQQRAKETTTRATTIATQLDRYGELLHNLLVELPEHPAITDTLDYVLGALHGLSQAYRLGFKNRSAKYSVSYHPHLAKYALKVPKGEQVNRLWTAGFYFNSGIQRLASTFDRIPQMLGATMKRPVGGRMRATTAKERMGEVNTEPYTHWEAVYDEINVFKHSPEGRAAGRTVTMDDALSAFEEMMQLISNTKAVLAERYKG